jgi:hypothetical protein
MSEVGGLEDPAHAGRFTRLEDPAHAGRFTRV